MTKAVSICLVCCILSTQLWWRPVYVHTDNSVAEAKSEVDDSPECQGLPCACWGRSVEGDASSDVVDGEPDSETGAPEDKPLNPILARAVLADKSGRLTKPLSTSRVLVLANHGQAVNCQCDPRGDLSELVAAASRCRTAHLLALARATRPHAPPLA